MGAEESHELDFPGKVLGSAVEVKRFGRMGSGADRQRRALKRSVTWSAEGFTWEADINADSSTTEHCG